MKKHDPNGHKRPVYPSDVNTMPCVVERSHENSPVSSSSSRESSVSNGSRSPAKLSPRSSNSPKRTRSPSPPPSPKCNGSIVERNSVGDSAFDVTPSKSKNIAELKTYIVNLVEKNQVLEERNKGLQDEMFNKIRYLSDLQERYDDCIDTIVQLNSQINQLENGCNLNSSGQTIVSIQSLQAKDREIAVLKRYVEDIEEEGKLWRVRCNLLDVDNHLLKTQMAELELIIVQLRKRSGDQSRPPSNRSKSKLSNRNLPERDAPVSMSDKDNLKQGLPSTETTTPKRTSLFKTTDSGRAIRPQSSTKVKELRNITPSLPTIECAVGRSKLYPRPPSHPKPKLHQSSTRSVTPIFNPIPLPTVNHFNLSHLPFPPSKPKTNKTRKYQR